MSDETAQCSLSGLLVLDLTQFLAGPYCTQILGDLGADIVKVEPAAGDPSRSVPPHFVAGDSAYYLCTNRNKRSIVVDMRSEGGRDIVRRIALRADVLVENNRPGVMERLGLRYDALNQDNPKLVWCSISGFGQDGPYRDRQAYDMVIQAMSGGMSMTGEPGGPPVRAGIPVADLSAGLYGTIGVLAALNERQRTGRGRKIDISMLDCQVAMLCYQAAYHLTSGHVPGRQGRAHDSMPTYGSFTAADGHEVLITANTEKMWQSLCQVLDCPELCGDPRFADNAARNRHRDALIPLLAAKFRAQPADHWFEKLVAAEIPCAPVNDLGQVLRDPQVLHRGMVLALEGERADQRARVAGNPLAMGEGTRRWHIYPPPLGADGQDILRDVLRMSADEIERLAAAGAWTPAKNKEHA
jgi:crotonobetainyl-CoA:carnitine CoA-transferase CaiB-like acyl-CoA transferase